MKRLLIYLALIFSVAVFAQQQADTGDEPGTESGDDAEEVSVFTDTETPEQADSLDDALPEADDPVDENENEDEDEAAPTEVGDVVETECDPDEEISEDYPIPLPSDI